MSVGGGSFSAGRVFRGGAQSSRPSQYYMGFWPCQQAEGDDDESQVTDRSGNGAHASIQSLTPAEAWANAGFFSSLASTNHNAAIPQAKWTHRFSTGSLIIAGVLRAVTDGANNLRFFGNGVSTSFNGFTLNVSASGGLQLVAYHPGGTSFSGAIAGVWGSLATKSFLAAYDLGTNSVTLYADAVRGVTQNKSISAADILAADTSVGRDTIVGGWATSSSLLASQLRFIHALDLRGRSLPPLARLDALAYRLHTHPRIMLRDKDFIE